MIVPSMHKTTGGHNVYLEKKKTSHCKHGKVNGHLGSLSRKNLSLEMDLSSLITMVTIVFSMLKITRRLKIF